MQSNRLKTTLENIPSSVLMIDKQGEIVIANHAYYEVFKPDSKVENKDYTVHLDKEIQHLVIESFKTENRCMNKLSYTLMMFIKNILMFLVFPS